MDKQLKSKNVRRDFPKAESGIRAAVGIFALQCLATRHNLAEKTREELLNDLHVHDNDLRRKLIGPLMPQYALLPL
jgi:hypothetical protein